MFDPGIGGYVGTRGHWVGRLLVLWILEILATNIETG